MNTKKTLLGLIDNPAAIYERQGLFCFANTSGLPITAVLKDMPKVTRLYRSRYKLDHVTLVLKNVPIWQNYIDYLVKEGGFLIEGPGLFPKDFCQSSVSMPTQLNFHFASVTMPTGLTIVLSCPHQVNDQLSVFLKQRGEGIHHLAFDCKDLARSSENCRSYNFTQLSNVIEDDELAQQFLINPKGQILELIHRKTPALGTFSCGNIAQLRLIERKAA
jgi:hypothetical protein